MLDKVDSCEYSDISECPIYDSNTQVCEYIGDGEKCIYVAEEKSIEDFKKEWFDNRLYILDYLQEEEEDRIFYLVDVYEQMMVNRRIKGIKN